MMDLNGIGWAHAKSISPLYAKRISSLLQVPSSACLCQIVLAFSCSAAHLKDDFLLLSLENQQISFI